jgi:putative ABC transport system permease protein
MAQMVSHIYDSMELFLSFMAFITLGLGGVGVMNIMLVSVAERTREIGVKQAVGATPNRILFEFFLEAISLTIFSGLAGLAVAWGICSAVSHLPLPTLFDGMPVSVKTALIAFGTLVLVGILSAIYPARRASLLAPVEALRYE